MNNRAIYTEEFFEQYLRNELIDPQRESFEEAMLQDETLRADFESYKKTFKGMEFYFENQLRQKISESLSDNTIRETGQTAKIRRFNPLQLGIAASLILLAAAAFLFFKTGKESGFEISDSAFANLVEMENNLNSTLGFADDQKVLSDAYLFDLSELSETEVESKLSMTQGDSTTINKYNTKLNFYKSLINKNYDQARDQLNTMKDLNEDGEYIDFLSCLLASAKANEAQECMAAFKTSSSRSIRNAAKNF